MYVGGAKAIQVTDHEIAMDMFSKDVFSGRFDLDAMTGSQNAAWLKGGHGMHGIIGGHGDEWKEQRRFLLRQLKVRRRATLYRR